MIVNDNKLYRVKYLTPYYSKERIGYFLGVDMLYINFSNSFYELYSSLNVTQEQFLNDIVNIVNTHSDRIKLEVLDNV